MKQENALHYILRLSLTLLLITSVMAGILALVNEVTEPRIAAARQEKTRRALSAVLCDAEQAEKLKFTDDTGLVRAVYGSPSGYAVEVASPGFDSAIAMMVGVGQDGKVLGISVISHTETPNLGAVAAEQTPKGEAFRSQFAGMRWPVEVKQDGGDVDAITGATITSRAVTTGVNAALRCAERLIHGR